MPPMALAVLRGDDASGQNIGRRLAAFSARYTLTPRQSEVLGFLGRGYGNKTIAERIGVTEGTVEEHVTSLFHKIRVDSRAALVARYWTD